MFRLVGPEQAGVVDPQETKQTYLLAAQTVNTFSISRNQLLHSELMEVSISESHLPTTALRELRS